MNTTTESTTVRLGPTFTAGQMAAGMRLSALIQSVAEGGVLHIERLDAAAIDGVISGVSGLTRQPREDISDMPMHALVDLIGQLLEVAPGLVAEYLNKDLTPAISALGERLAGIAAAVQPTAPAAD